MWNRLKLKRALLLPIGLVLAPLLYVWQPTHHGPSASAAETSSAPADELQNTRQAFVAAMQRIRLHLPDIQDSPALEAYVIHDYLVAARLRRDLAIRPGDDLDAAIDAFL